jgi:hypothetical protein
MSTTDDRELGVRVYDVFVGVEDELGTVPNVVDAGPVTLATPAKATTAPAGKGAATSAKPAPAAAKAAPAKPTPAPVKK